CKHHFSASFTKSSTAHGLCWALSNLSLAYSLNAASNIPPSIPSTKSFRRSIASGKCFFFSSAPCPKCPCHALRHCLKNSSAFSDKQEEAAASWLVPSCFCFWCASGELLVVAGSIYRAVSDKNRAVSVPKPGGLALSTGRF